MKRCQKIWAGTSPAWLFNEINPDTFRQNSTCTFPALSTTQQSLLHSLPESHLDVLGYYWKPRDIWIIGLQCQRLLWLSFLVSCAGFVPLRQPHLMCVIFTNVLNYQKMQIECHKIPIEGSLQRPVSFCKTENQVSKKEMPGQSKHQSEFQTGSPFRQKAILSMIDEAKEEMEDGEVERQKREECSTSNNSTPAGGGHVRALP